jgi:hypothetical protein
VFVNGIFIINANADFDVVIVQPGPIPAVITLPPATAATIGRFFDIRALQVDQVRVVAVPGDSVEGAQTITIRNGHAEMLMSDGGKRWISVADRSPATQIG